MKLYLSSYGVGNRATELQTMASGRTIGVVPNAIDYVDTEARALSVARNLAQLRDLGIATTELDLRAFFGNPQGLARALDDIGGVWVRGGNTFVLRQAMRLSGFDALLRDRTGTDFLYGGYSAGVCVLGPRLEGLHHVDDPAICPYPNSEVVWEGLGILSYLVLPHYQSDHPEAGDIDKDVEYCLDQGIVFRTLRDGEVIVEEVPPTPPR